MEHRYGVGDLNAGITPDAMCIILTLLGHEVLEDISYQGVKPPGRVSHPWAHSSEGADGSGAERRNNTALITRHGQVLPSNLPAVTAPEGAGGSRLSLGTDGKRGARSTRGLKA